MILNSLDQNFICAVDWNWFYPEVCATWQNTLRRMYLPYPTLEDFFNSQISSVNFPGINANNPTQKIQLYDNVKRTPYQVDQLINKQITLNVHTSESYITYFIMRQQFEVNLRLGERAKVNELFFAPITISLLSDGGFETVSYTFKNLTPVSLSDLTFSYAARLGNFATYSVTFAYNYYDVYVSDGENYGDRTKISEQIDPIYDFGQENIQNTVANDPAGRPISTVSTQYNDQRNRRQLKSMSNYSGPVLINTTLRK